MRIGLCLSGGGAKGAFQAGVIKGLYDNGINRYEAISGTSIGAVNGYYVFTHNVEKLEQMWTNLEVDLKKDIKIVNNTVDNTYIIEGLKNLDNNKDKLLKLPIAIEDMFSMKSNRDIYLIVDYNGHHVVAKTNFVFTKEGMNSAD